MTTITEQTTVHGLVTLLADKELLIVRVGRRRREDGPGWPWVAVLEERWSGSESPQRYQGGGHSFAACIEDALAAVALARRALR